MTRRILQGLMVSSHIPSLQPISAQNLGLFICYLAFDFLFLGPRFAQKKTRLELVFASSAPPKPSSRRAPPWSGRRSSSPDSCGRLLRRWVCGGFFVFLGQERLFFKKEVVFFEKKGDPVSDFLFEQIGHHLGWYESRRCFSEAPRVLGRSEGHQKPRQHAHLAMPWMRMAASAQEEAS